jgi:broad specificity phosphatase PhoE
LTTPNNELSHGQQRRQYNEEEHSHLAFPSFPLITMTETSAAKKTVYLIRHAESEENRKVASLKKVFGGLTRFSLPSSSDVWTASQLINVPAQVDSSVSEIGVKQIANMASQLQQAKFVETAGVELVVHSPLVRAEETSEGLLGCRAPTTKHTSVDRVEVLDILREKTPTEWIPGNSGALRQRMSDFEDWLVAQPETIVAVVGHSQYFKAMLNLSYKFGNCDVYKVEYDAERKLADSSSTGPKDELPPQWSGLTRLYECNFSCEAEESKGDE